MIERGDLSATFDRAWPLDDEDRFPAMKRAEEKTMFVIEIYRRARLFGRPEWRWRARARNGEVLANSTEGYINRGDLDDELEELRLGFASAKIVSVDQ